MYIPTLSRIWWLYSSTMTTTMTMTMMMTMTTTAAATAMAAMAATGAFVKCYAHKYVHFSHPVARTPNNSLPIPQNEQILLIRLQNLIHFIDIVYSNGNIIVPCVGSLQCVHFTSAISKAVSIVICSFFYSVALGLGIAIGLALLSLLILLLLLSRIVLLCAFVSSISFIIIVSYRCVHCVSGNERAVYMARTITLSIHST